MKVRRKRSGRWRRRTPTVLQMEAVECGAACLCMVLGYYGRYVALEDARIACGVSRDGSKASNLVRAARRYGLVARGIRTEPDALEEVGFPSILHWNLNHFVVLEGMTDRWVYLNDPAFGPRRVSREELDCSFSGIVLAFEVGDAFRRAGRPFRASATLLRRLRGASWQVAFVVVAALLLVGPGLLGPAFSKVFVDEILVAGTTDWLRPLLLAMLAAAIVSGGLTLLQREYLLRFETQLSAGGSARFFWHVLRLPITFFAQRYGGEVGSRVATNDRIASMLSGELAVSFVSALTVVFYAAAMARYDIRLALIGVSAALVNVVVLVWIGRERRDANQRLLQERGKMIGAAMGGLQTIETLKASGSESDFFSRWSGHHAKMLNAQQHLGLRTAALTVVPPAVAAVASASVLGLGATRVIDGAMTMGALVAFQGLLSGFLAPIGARIEIMDAQHHDLVLAVTSHLPHLIAYTIVGTATDLEDVLKAEPDQSAAGGHVVAATSDREASSGSDESGMRSRSARLRGEITVRDLTFGFSPLDPPLISDFTLSVAAGECIALVGGSGSGKSTLARLLCGLYKPWSGEVLLDGLPRDAHDPRVLCSSIGYVDQEIFLFEGSVRDNLCLWDDTVAEPVVVRAAKDAHVHDLIVMRPGAYAAPVEEGGRNFSGGQRQRMEIARALALRPSILIMDEATSALDAETERRVSDSVRRRGCTCIIVAHRLSAVRDADRILVLDRGRVVEEGDHAYLLQKGGRYLDLMQHE